MTHLLALALSVAPPPAPDPAAYLEPAAVLLNLSEHDLNRIVVDSFHAHGWPELVGERARVSSSVTDLRYRGSLSEPVLRVGEDRTARLSLEILDATLRIGIERRIIGVAARCEGAGVDVDPTRPLSLGVTLDFALERGNLRIVPRTVEIPDVRERLRIVRPERCTSRVFPSWFLWWVGRPFVKRKVDDLDRVLLEKARRSAERLESEEALRGSRIEDLHLVPEVLDTSAGSLLVGLRAAGSQAATHEQGEMEYPAPSDFPSRSFLAVSESLVNELSRRLVAGRSGSLRSSVHARKLLASDALYVLIPGLRERAIGSGEALDLEVVFTEAPRFRLGTAPDGSPLVRIVVSGTDLHVGRRDGGKTTRLGTLHVDRGEVAAVPTMNVLGGISLRIVENRWHVSSSGLAFDDALVAATLQEMAFGKIFETTYRPLLARALRIGDSDFLPRGVTVVDGYLVIELGEPAPPEEERSPGEVAMRTGSPPASR